MDASAPSLARRGLPVLQRPSAGVRKRKKRPHLSKMRAPFIPLSLAAPPRGGTVATLLSNRRLYCLPEAFASWVPSALGAKRVDRH